jgi:hypothetical protein
VDRPSVSRAGSSRRHGAPRALCDGDLPGLEAQRQPFAYHAEPHAQVANRVCRVGIRPRADPARLASLEPIFAECPGVESCE